MQCGYGNYSCDNNSVGWTTSEQLLREGNQPIARKITVTLNGKIFGNSVNELAAKSGAMRNAFRMPYQNLVLRNNGTIIEQLSSQGSTTGVLCVAGPDFTEARGAEYATYRTFTATFEAEYPLPTGLPIVVESSQTITTEGGFPIIVWQLSVNGPPRKVVTCPQTTFKMAQTGRAVGLIDYPIVPPPLFPLALMDNPRIVRSSPERVGQGYRNFPVEWEYRFESDVPLIALPGLPL